MNDISLKKALEAGSYNAAPGTLSQGSALQKENLSPIMQNVTYSEKSIKFQKELSVVSTKANLYQFDRQLSFGKFGGSAAGEGQIGAEQTDDFIRSVVPMAYYSERRRITIAANSVDTVDGVKAEERVAKSAAIRLAGDIEFDCYKGRDDFSNAGVFDGNPLAAAELFSMVGASAQIRQSDSLANAQDLMFAHLGSAQSVVLPANGNLSQSLIEDLAVRSAMNHGTADQLHVDPMVLSTYNKIAFAKERFVQAGSNQETSGASLRKQMTSGSPVELIASRFLSGKTGPSRSVAGAPAAPAAPAATHTGSDGVIPAGSYIYVVTAENDKGESAPVASASVPVAAGEHVELTIAAVSGAKLFNVYRSKVGGSADSAAFIGRVKASGAGSTVFTDLGNKIPGFVTGLLIQKDTWEMPELMPFSKTDLAMTALEVPTAFYRFVCLAGLQPRKNVIADNLKS